MNYDKRKQSFLVKVSMLLLKALAFLLFVFCFYQACKITTI